MKRLTFLSSLLVLLVFWTSSCKNDLDIFTEPTEQTVVYGLLDSKDSVHYFKVNKLFQGPGDVNQLAKDPSLMKIENLQARLSEFKVDKNGDTIATGLSWPLQETVISNKDSGMFYYPDQVIYKVEALLDAQYIYKVEIERENGDNVYAYTKLIGVTGEILNNSSFYQYQAGLSLAGPTSVPDEIKVQLIPPVNAKVIQVFLDFMWYDQYLDGTESEEHVISYPLGTFEVSKVRKTPQQVTDMIQVRFSPKSFYEFIADHIPAIEQGSNIKQRIPTNKPDNIDEAVSLNFRFIIGDPELYTYMEVASPSTSLIEDKPAYSNIVNGIGVFASRNFEHQFAKMSQPSLDELVDGYLLGLTGDRGFCHPSKATHPKSCY